MSAFLREMQRWVAAGVGFEFDHWKREEPPSGRLLLGTLVYGRYAARFMRYCVTSLQSKGNLEGLSTRPLLSIHTDELSFPILQRGLEDLHEVADVEVHYVAEDLTKVNRGDNSLYVLLGASELIHMKRAFFRGMHYHCMFPDVVYPAGYFRRLERLVREEFRSVVLSHSINASIEDLGPKIHNDMDAGELANLALESIHDRLRPFVMNERKGDFPIVPHFVFVGRDRVYVAGMHANVVFLHNRLLGFAPLRLNTTLDAQLPYYLPEEVSLYMPKRDDGLTLVELSDEDFTNFYKRRGCPIKELALRFWALAEGHPGFERILAETSEFPLACTSRWEMDESEIQTRLQKFRQYVRDIYPAVEHAFEMGGILEETGLNGPLYLPQERMVENARRAAS